MDRFARVGLVCRAVLYGLIGILALQVAFGGGGHQADKSGAISAVASLPFGTVLLWIMAVGFFALAVWQLTEAIWGPPKMKRRVESGSRVVVYGLVVWSLLTLLLSGRTKQDDQQSRDATSTLLGLPGGRFIVGAVGLGIIALGAYWIWRGIKKEFRRDLGPMPPRASTWMNRLGMIGYIARGVIAALAGFFVIEAAITYDPDKAGGIDATLRSFAETPVGPWLLVVVALGVVLFAVYCLGEARWRRT